MRSNGRLLLSRIGQQRHPFSPSALHFASYVRFHTSHNPIASEERRGVWHLLKNYLGWNKNKQESRVIVPEAEAYATERDGKHFKTLTSGNHSLIPTHDKVAYVHPIKEGMISIPDQPALTKDSAPISVDGSLCVKIVDPKLAAEKPMQSVIELARTTMCYEIRKMTLNEIFEKRDILNGRILMGISDIAKNCGLDCTHYNIVDTSMRNTLRGFMETYVEVSRRERASLMASPGHEFGD